MKAGDVLARSTLQDYQNRLRSAEADVISAEASWSEAQGAEERQAKLLKDGYTPQSNYDAALRRLRSAEARSPRPKPTWISPATSSTTRRCRPISTASSPRSARKPGRWSTAGR